MVTSASATVLKELDSANVKLRAIGIVAVPRVVGPTNFLPVVTAYPDLLASRLSRGLPLCVVDFGANFPFTPLPLPMPLPLDGAGFADFPPELLPLEA